MSEPIKSEHALILNRLSEMQRAPYYASAREEHKLAEQTILTLERELAEARKVIALCEREASNRLTEVRRDHAREKLSLESDAQTWEQLDDVLNRLVSQRDKLRSALAMTQRTFSGTFEDGWTILVTGYEMIAIREALKE